MYCKHCYKMIPDDSVICPECGRPIKGGRKVRVSGSTLILMLILAAAIGIGVFKVYQRVSTPKPKPMETIQTSGDTLRIGSITFDISNVSKVETSDNISYLFTLVENEAWFALVHSDVSKMTEADAQAYAEQQQKLWLDGSPDRFGEENASTQYFADTPISFVSYGTPRANGQTQYNMTGSFVYNGHAYTLSLICFDPDTAGIEKFVVMLTNSAYQTTGQVWSNGRNLSEEDTKNPTTFQNQFLVGEPSAHSIAETYSAGMYKVGIDLPSGEYIITATEDNGYYCVSSDANKDDIIENDFFSGNAIITVFAGQYFEVSNATFVSSMGAKVPAGNSFSDGMYRVGLDISAGEYKLTSIDDHGYYVIYSNSIPPLDIQNNDFFEGSSYVTVNNGEYLSISGCTAIKTG